MSIASEITRIIDSKEDIVRALSRKGVQIPDGSTLDGFAEIIEPITKGQVIQWTDNPDNYLRFKFVTDGQVKWKNVKGDIQYSKNGGAWTAFNGDIVSMSVGDEIWFKGDLTGGVGESFADTASKFFTIGKFYASGNVQSLCSFDNTLQNYHFAYLFYNNVGLNIDISTPLLLPATTLTNNCYQYMFAGCASLVTAPELPAETLADRCYSGMFLGCASLTTAPELPVTTLMSGCYNGMFQNCYSLIVAPELPATTLTNNCYQYMFYGCVSLTVAPELPATTLANQCYYFMFRDCTSLTSAPELPATTLADNCYNGMFYNCYSLTAAPELPATTLMTACYGSMFQNCTSLNYIKALFTSTPGYSYTGNWVKGVASTGTFVKSSEATWTTTGNNGVPTGWTVETE